LVRRSYPAMAKRRTKYINPENFDNEVILVKKKTKRIRLKIEGY